MVAGRNMAPDDIFLSVMARPNVKPGQQEGELHLKFALSPNTLQLNPERGLNVHIYPIRRTTREYYSLTNGNIDIDVLDGYGFKVCNRITAERIPYFSISGILSK